MAIPDKKKSSYVQELERRANDTLIVYNPLDEDHVVEWDRRGGVKLFRVTAKSEAPLPRYIAEKYLKEMYTRIVNTKAANAIKEENERRLKAGMAILDKTQKTGEQEAFESPFYNMQDDEAKKIISILYVGVEREFGIDSVTEAKKEIDDSKPVYKRAMETVQEEKVSGKPVSVEKTTQDKPSEATQPVPEQFKCEFPDCDFTTKAKIALFNHRKTHRPDIDSLEEKKKAAAATITK